MNKFPTLRNLVASNKVELAIQKFIEWAPANCSGHQDEGVMLAHRYASARGNSHAGVISWQERMEMEKSVVTDFLELLQVCEREQNESRPDDQPGESAGNENQNRATIEIVIEGNLSDFPSRRQKLFLLLLGLILNIDFHHIIIKKMDKGSIVLTLEMPLESALELRKLFEESAPELRPLLDEFKVLKTPELLTPEPAQPQQPFRSGRIFQRKKIGTVQKINSMQHFRELIAERGEENAIGLAFQLFYDKMKVHLIYKFRSELPDDIIEDAILSAFAEVLSFAKSYRETSIYSNSFFYFLYRVAFNFALDYLKRNRSRNLEALEDSSLENLTGHLDSENWTDQEKLRKAIDQLPEYQRQILQLYFQGFSNEEIAQMLGYKSADIVKTMRYRIINKLREILKK